MGFWGTKKKEVYMLPFARHILCVSTFQLFGCALLKEINVFQIDS